MYIHKNVIIDLTRPLNYLFFPNFILK